MQGPVLESMLRRKWVSLFALELSKSRMLFRFSSSSPSDLADSSVSDRLRLAKPIPLCFELVLRRDWSNSRLVFPCNLASLAISLSSSNMSSDEASSSVSMCSPDPSAKVKLCPSMISFGGSTSPGFSCSTEVTSGNDLGLSNSSTAADMSPISP